MSFEYALNISSEGADTLVIEFVDPDIFISDKGIKIPEEYRRLTRKLMRQIPTDSKATQESINEQADNS